MNYSKDETKTITIARDGEYATTILKNAMMRVAMMSQAAASESLGALAAALNFVVAGKARLLEGNCEHRQEEAIGKYPVVCMKCVNDTFNMCPFPLLVRDTAEDGGETWAAIKYTVMFVPSAFTRTQRYDNTRIATEAFLDTLDTEEDVNVAVAANMTTAPMPDLSDPSAWAAAGAVVTVDPEAIRRAQAEAQGL